jgi:hypothetical protein
MTNAACGRADAHYESSRVAMMQGRQAHCEGLVAPHFLSLLVLWREIEREREQEITYRVFAREVYLLSR